MQDGYNHKGFVSSAVMISVLFTDKTQSGNEHEYQDDSF